MKEDFEIFNLKERTIVSFLKGLSIPEVEELEESEIYKTLLEVRKVRNKLLKFSFDLRDFKIRFSSLKDKNEICKFAHTGLVGGPGQALDHGYADAHACEGAGTVGYRQQVHIPERELGIFQHVLSHRQEGAAVGQAAALTVLADQSPVPQQRGGGRFRAGFKGQDQHSSTPSIVILRSLSASFSMVTRISSPKKASCTFSLHSTAHTAPRLR